MKLQKGWLSYVSELLLGGTTTPPKGEHRTQNTLASGYVEKS